MMAVTNKTTNEMREKIKLDRLRKQVSILKDGLNKINQHTSCHYAASVARDTIRWIEK